MLQLQIISGALFASKAFVQLAINPLVGTVTARFGYSAPLMCGTATLLLSALSKNLKLDYRVTEVVARLGLVDLDLESSTVL